MSNRAKIRKRAEQLKGRPVCVTLHDGRTYVGWITGLDKDGLTLSKPRKNKNKNKKSKKHSSSRSRKANVSGLMPLFGSLFGMGGGAAGAAESASSGASGFGGIMGFVGMIQRTMPVVKMGYNMIKSISPFLNGLKGLMG
ncbi:hypothetical protein MKX41_25805 [Paenibacillus sp. FSL R5-0475]|uniref:hypothetical protein n=1 Tax=unclassified Paenibacillus TaxID=185978 RepID=UPI0004F8BE41|nr:hypothetical protein [Paenibacillus sp. FSL H7-0737]AIQ21589.1 hypothetical protein H70737_01175 [Paenibacillus sp. FSL H7-0737]